VTDDALVAKKLARMEQCLADLGRVDATAIHSDVVIERFVEHTLQIAVQAAIDVASHLVSDGALGQPRTNAELFDLLARGGVLDAALATVLAHMAGFRNVLVHEYDDVDLAVVRDVLEHHLDDLRRFVDAVRSRSRDTGR
jgi:uncharacterized protein YutE (UPF0331/DUF86 family)